MTVPVGNATITSPVAAVQQLMHDGRTSEFIIRELICSFGLTGPQAVGALLRACRLGETDGDGR